MPAKKNASNQSGGSLPTPQPVVVSEVCSICGEDWGEHPEKATVLDCVEILKRRPKFVTGQWQHYQSVIPPYTINAPNTNDAVHQGNGYTIDSSGSVRSFGANVTPIYGSSQAVWFDRGDDDDGTAGVRVPA
jgi:hypothetical protein